jgi:tetratricopeptide (TPR) repeat protein
MNTITNKLYDNIVLGNYKYVEELLWSSNNTNKDCYLALVHALQRDIYTAKKCLMQINETDLSEIERLVYLEAKVVTSYLSGSLKETEKYAEQALSLNDRAFFARSLLARVLTWRKEFDLALEHYKSLLEMYPLDGGVLLDLAFCLIAKGDYQESIGYVRKAKKSFRRSMYLLLIPLKKTSVRLLLALVILLLFLTPIGASLFAWMSLLILLGIVITLLRLGLDPLIITRLISLQVIITGMWLVSWIISKY